MFDQYFACTKLDLSRWLDASGCVGVAVVSELFHYSMASLTVDVHIVITVTAIFHTYCWDNHVVDVYFQESAKAESSECNSRRWAPCRFCTTCQHASVVIRVHLVYVTSCRESQCSICAPYGAHMEQQKLFYDFCCLARPNNQLGRYKHSSKLLSFKSIFGHGIDNYCCYGDDESQWKSPKFEPWPY